MKNKTTDYILGFITGVAVVIAVYSFSTSKLYADDFYDSYDDDNYVSSRGDSKYNPLYVKVVE